MPQSIMECDDEDEEEKYFLTAPLDDKVWSEEPIPEKDLCIPTPMKKSEAGYNP